VAPYITGTEILPKLPRLTAEEAEKQLLEAEKQLLKAGFALIRSKDSQRIYIKGQRRVINRRFLCVCLTLGIPEVDAVGVVPGEKRHRHSDLGGSTLRLCGGL